MGSNFPEIKRAEHKKCGDGSYDLFDSLAFIRRVREERLSRAKWAKALAEVLDELSDKPARCVIDELVKQAELDEK